MSAIWLTLFFYQAGTRPRANLRNAEFAVWVSPVEEAGAQHHALLRGGANGCMPSSNTVMYPPVRHCCIDDPFGVRVDDCCPLSQADDRRRAAMIR